MLHCLGILHNSYSPRPHHILGRAYSTDVILIGIFFAFFPPEVLFTFWSLKLPFWFEKQHRRNLSIFGFLDVLEIVARRWVAAAAVLISLYSFSFPALSVLPIKYIAERNLVDMVRSAPTCCVSSMVVNFHKVRVEKARTKGLDPTEYFHRQKDTHSQKMQLS